MAPCNFTFPCGFPGHFTLTTLLLADGAAGAVKYVLVGFMGYGTFDVPAKSAAPLGYVKTHS